MTPFLLFVAQYPAIRFKFCKKRSGLVTCLITGATFRSLIR
jgi:hypothetical protein